MTRSYFIRLASLLALVFAFSSAVAAQEASPNAKAAIGTLQKKGVITQAEADYWIQNARKDIKCPGEKVGALIIKCVSAKKKVTTISEACDYLDQKKILSKTDFWRTNAIAKKNCDGGGVGVLLQRLAKVVE